MTLLGNIIVGLVVALIAFLSGRAFIRDLKRQLKGGGCSACGGSCCGCSGSCHCGDDLTTKTAAK